MFQKRGDLNQKSQTKPIRKQDTRSKSLEKKKRLQVLVLDTKYKISTLKETMKTKTKN